MKRPINEVIAMLNALPLDAEIDVLNVWSNGRKVRRLCGQDEDSVWHPAGEFRKMVAILLPEVSVE
ncbi:hypothetical protein C162_26010 [Paenibacillus sp. FSL R7-269]|uniref:hypothetical protein n=1 Tax=Paenibacillus sp. FSL R7-269 TaxID=1226755 RepID=UPI0003E225CD|nr:hypothetical protein [Paenibacillus sp. FSL R7-269]ETT41593.1 hypothetical protein C162_26010 [Paenibacillus sp. FSL R7-269]